MNPSEVIDRVEAGVLSSCDLVQCPVECRYIEGPEDWKICERTMYARKGTFISTEVHEVEHPFNLSEGVVAIYDSHGKKVVLQAPYRGTTKPGTRRMMLVLEDITFTTYHMTRTTDPEETIAEVTSRADNPYIKGPVVQALRDIRERQTRKELS